MLFTSIFTAAFAWAGEVFFFIKQTFPFPRLVNFASAGLQEGRSCREKRPLPDSDLGLKRSCKKSRQPVKSICRKPPNCRFQLQKRSQLFIATSDKPLSVAICVSMICERLSASHIPGFCISVLSAGGKRGTVTVFQIAREDAHKVAQFDPAAVV